jgi:hypothetical protein
MLRLCKLWKKFIFCKPLKSEQCRLTELNEMKSTKQAKTKKLIKMKQISKKYFFCLQMKIENKIVFYLNVF